MEKKVWKIKRKLAVFDDKTIPLRSILLNTIKLAREYKDPPKDIIILIEQIYKRHVLDNQININQGKIDYGESEVE